MSSEFRRDPYGGDWQITAPSRAERPGGAVRAEAESAASVDEDPFLEGREGRTPPEVFAIRPEGSPANGPGWSVRIIPNQYPAVVAESVEVECFAPFEGIAAVGRHEVVVDCPHFETCTSRLTLAGVVDVLTAYRERMRALRSEGRWACVIVFKNKGRPAGATIPHAHSQLTALPFVPRSMRVAIDEARRTHERTGRSPIVETIEAELAAGSRVVAERSEVAVFCPHASRFPFECRIVPTDAEPRFEETGDDRLASVAELLKGTLTALHATVGECPYNLVLRSLPFEDTGEAPWFRWSLDVLPRLGTLGGYELATGAFMTPIAAEQAATKLREAWVTRPE